MKFEMTTVLNIDGAIRGMRNPLESWQKSDSDYAGGGQVIIGPNDLKLMQNLLRASIKEGNSHSKFMRQIAVCVDITAPLYWWKDMDQYRVGVTTNSTSTMHKLATTQITRERFEVEDVSNLKFYNASRSDVYTTEGIFKSLLDALEGLRLRYLETQDKRYWKELVRLLPESWLQTRTTTLNYQVLRQIYFDRRNHKLTEWSEDMMLWIKSLPYATELIMYEGVADE